MKYSIIISNVLDDVYAVICKAWQVDSEGKEVNIVTLNKSGLTLEQAQNIVTNFIKTNG